MRLLLLLLLVVVVLLLVVVCWRTLRACTSNGKHVPLKFVKDADVPTFPHGREGTLGHSSTLDAPRGVDTGSRAVDVSMGRLHTPGARGVEASTQHATALAFTHGISFAF